MIVCHLCIIYMYVRVYNINVRTWTKCDDYVMLYTLMKICVSFYTSALFASQLLVDAHLDILHAKCILILMQMIISLVVCNATHRDTFTYPTQSIMVLISAFNVCFLM